MTIFQVPLRMEVPACGEVEVEAESLEAACLKVEAEIRAEGFYCPAADVEFEADWGESYDLRVADVKLPDGRIFRGRGNEGS